MLMSNRSHGGSSGLSFGLDQVVFEDFADKLYDYTRIMIVDVHAVDTIYRAEVPCKCIQGGRKGVTCLSSDKPNFRSKTEIRSNN
ncbi:hypothetical protein IFM47457_10760 [Aspergillus lentulus]|nr:hypothetical protein IFM47457_10760 [Aspergillus lentulus]